MGISKAGSPAGAALGEAVEAIYKRACIVSTRGLVFISFVQGANEKKPAFAGLFGFF